MSALLAGASPHRQEEYRRPVWTRLWTEAEKNRGPNSALCEHSVNSWSGARTASRTGWLLLATGLGFAAWLDPATLAAAPTERLHALRELLGVLLLAGLQLLLVGELTARANPEGSPASIVRRDRTAPLGLAHGVVGATVVWVVARVFVGTHLAHPAAAAPAAVLQAGALALLLPRLRSQGGDVGVLGLLVALGIGAGMDLVTSLLLIDGSSFGWAPVAWDALPLRMLRLARVASIALAALGWGQFRSADTPAAIGPPRWARFLAVQAAWAMPVALILSAVISPDLKYLLPLPAYAALIPAAAAALRDLRLRRLRSGAGWALAAGSMAVGLALGGWSFDGPLPAPPGFESYTASARQAVRLGHADAVLFGLLLLYSRSGSWLPAGAGWTVFGWVAASLGLASPALMAVGPAAGAVGCLIEIGAPGPRDAESRRGPTKNRTSARSG